MEILTYSPNVEAYVAVTGQGGKVSAYYNLSQDITSCNINRKMDAASTFTIKLQNKNGKYNGIFTPMDRIIIYATGADGKKYQQLSGYITTVDRFTLFAQDFTIKGKDVLYQLQELFWDPNLTESQNALMRSDYYDKQDAGFSGVIKTLLVNIAGWDESRIYISPTFPDEVINWAYELYDAQKSDIEGIKTIVDDFYNIMATSGLLVGGTNGQTLGDTNGGSDTADNAMVEAACKWAIGIANDDSHGYDQANRYGPDYDCSSLVCTAFKTAGFDVPVTTTFNMKGAFESVGFKWYDRYAAELSSYSKLKRGDILLNIEAHTELYIGGGQNVGAHIDENGGIKYGQSGDQTGNEISCGAYWDDNWDGILRYEG